MTLEEDWLWALSGRHQGVRVLVLRMLHQCVRQQAGLGPPGTAHRATTPLVSQKLWTGTLLSAGLLVASCLAYGDWEFPSVLLLSPPPPPTFPAAPCQLPSQPLPLSVSQVLVLPQPPPLLFLILSLILYFPVFKCQSTWKS